MIFHIVRNYFLVSLAGMFILHSKAYAANRLAVFVIGGAQTTEQNFAPFVNSLNLVPDQILVRFPNTNPFTANHMINMKEYQIDFQAFSQKNTAGVVLFAYSGGGKFAAKLAQENANVQGVFLIDPVDGPPPFTNDENRFPTVLKEDSPIFKMPFVIVKSELGSSPGLFGIPCVPPNYGPEHFARFVEPIKLKFYLQEGASHLDFLYPPLKLLAANACARSQEISGTARANALTAWLEFWNDLNSKKE